MDACKSNPNEMWSVLQQILPNYKGNSIRRMEFDGEIIDNKMDMCERLNSY